ncbi:MAG: hypothetical protein WCP97_04840 [bacterium]
MIRFQQQAVEYFRPSAWQTLGYERKMDKFRNSYSSEQKKLDKNLRFKFLVCGGVALGVLAATGIFLTGSSLAYLGAAGVCIASAATAFRSTTIRNTKQAEIERTYVTGVNQLEEKFSQERKDNPASLATDFRELILYLCERGTTSAKSYDTKQYTLRGRKTGTISSQFLVISEIFLGQTEPRSYYNIFDNWDVTSDNIAYKKAQDPDFRRTTRQALISVVKDHFKPPQINYPQYLQ